MRHVDLIGLEAEFLPLHNGKPVDCAELNVPCDDFSALAEVRAQPGNCKAHVYGNFGAEFHCVKKLCRAINLDPFFGEFEWDESVYQTFRDKMIAKCGGKPKESWRNIHGLSLKQGRSKRGGGLHIHFSSRIMDDNLAAGHSSGFSLLTMPAIESIVRDLDNQFQSVITGCEGPYRVLGMWEAKPWGFEYRSLPFNEWAIDNMFEIVECAFAAFYKAIYTP